MYVYYPICSRNFTGYLFIVNPDAVESGVKVEHKPDFKSDTADLRITWDTRMFPHDILAGHKDTNGPLDIWINFLDNEKMVWYRGYKLAEGIPNTGNADFSINIDQLPEEVLNHPTTISVEPRDTEKEEEDSYSPKHEPGILDNHKISKEDQKKMERRIDQSKMKPWMKIGTKLLLRTLIRISGPLGWIDIGAF